MKFDIDLGQEEDWRRGGNDRGSRKCSEMGGRLHE